MNLIDLLGHPVLACFVAMKWERLLAYFYVHTAMFFLFLANYYGYIVYLMNTNYSSLMAFDGSENNTRKCKNNTIYLPYFLQTWDSSGFFVCELLFLLFTILFVSSEIVQMIRLRWNYTKELGNYIQLFVIVSAFLSMIFKPSLLGKDYLAHYSSLNPSLT